MADKTLTVQNEQVRKKKILVIDDNQEILQLIEQWLTVDGFDVILADAAAEGFKRAIAETPDVIVTDILMPDMDGIQFIHQLRGRSSDTWIVAMSGGGDLLPALTALHLSKSIGANRTVMKPMNKEELIDAIREGIDR